MTMICAAASIICTPTGAITKYRTHGKPALGPAGDDLNDFVI